MLYFLAVWTILLIVCSTIGLSGLAWLPPWPIQRAGDRWIVSVWLGTILLAITLLAVALIHPLSLGTGLLTATLLGGIAIVRSPVRSELRTWIGHTRRWGLLISGIAIGLAILATQQVTWLDTGLYHYSLIQWLHQIGIVPGIALIFANFAFNSAWFALAAPLSPSPIGDQVSAVLGGWVLLLAILQIGICGRSIQRGEGQLSDWFLVSFSLLMLLFSLLWPTLQEISISPSPDTPVAFLTGLVPWSMLVIAHRSAPTSTELPAIHLQPAHAALLTSPNPQMPLNDAIVPLVLAIGALTFKLTAMPLVLIAGAFYGWRNRSRWSAWFVGFSITLILSAPFFIAQIQTSGCPLFPSNLFCLSLPVTVPPDVSDAVVQNTLDWQSWYQGSDQKTSTLQLLRRWLISSRSHQLLVAIIVISLVSIGLSIQSLIRYWPVGIVWVLATQVVSMAFHATTTLMFRFVLPSLLLIPALLIAFRGCQTELHRHLSLRNPGWTPQRSGTILLAASVMIGLMVRSGHGLILPPPLPTVEVTLKQASNFAFFSPQTEGELCWGTQIPCAFKIKPNIQLRDPDRGFSSGFIRKTP